jgi:hypothetical protein
MCNRHDIASNQAAIIAMFGVVNRYIGSLPLMPVSLMKEAAD